MALLSVIPPESTVVDAAFLSAAFLLAGGWPGPDCDPCGVDDCASAAESPVAVSDEVEPGLEEPCD